MSSLVIPHAVIKKDASEINSPVIPYLTVAFDRPSSSLPKKYSKLLHPT
jgi:hypothetical protein